MSDSQKTDAAGIEIDPVTNQPTTGHVWDGIRELNRPLPRWWLWTFYATIAFSLVYVVLYPSVPLISGATAGLLGYSTRASVEEAVVAAREAQKARLDQIAVLPLEQIRSDAELSRFASAGGRAAFLVNCVPCHGNGAAGSKGYPNLNDDDWIWGGSLAAIHQTIIHGIRSPTDPDTRVADMPAFGGPAGTLSHEQIGEVADHVLALSGKPHDEASAALGAAIFADNCASCHGEKGEGNREVGGPALNDAINLKAANRDEIIAQIAGPKMGVMPAWGGRLSEATIKELAIYVHALGGGEADAEPQ
jgi:cytochrome c oxidase cbb3-type subunit 3